MRKLTALLTIAALGLGVTPALADVGIDARQANQQRQIDAGGRSGKLSRRERTVLTNEQRMIKSREARLRTRGGFGNRDQAVIMSMLDRSQAHIVRLKNNRERGRGFRI